MLVFVCSCYVVLIVDYWESVEEGFCNVYSGNVYVDYVNIWNVNIFVFLIFICYCLLCCYG